MTPINLGHEQISSLATFFAEKTSFTPGEDIFAYVKENLHGKIEYSNGNADSSGGSIKVEKGGSFTIYLSRITSEKRDVFTIAHELGHFVLHSRLGSSEIKAHRTEEKEYDKAEQEANTFAAAFLMPEDRIKESFSKNNGNIEAIAEEFKVSYTAMSWRCRNLKLSK